MPRRLGQHFLTSPSTLGRIAGSACPEREQTVIEIGAGRGALTDHLAERADRVVALEVDPVLAQYLRVKFRARSNVEIVEQDVLKSRLEAWTPAVIAGNLPYYITSPIIQKIVQLAGQWPRAVLLVQKEVALRLAALPGSRDYGFLSVQTQLQAHAEVLFTVPAGAFSPPPKVESAVVRLTPRHEQQLAETDSFLRFAALCFRQKRKTLRNNLLGAYGKELLDSVPQTAQRAEQLSIAELQALRRTLRDLGASATGA